MPNNSGRGRDGEEKAAVFLEGKGMKILARNLRFRQGEADIVALDGDTVVFAEVKAWSAYGIEELRYKINREKQRRIIETAKYFLFSHREYKGMAVRFDVVFLGPEGVTHLVSAFTERV
ncbi:MAG: YraN family protein [Treponema sp.]|jgi:putative endonuclease|nr:YraN family protein [Treponema sp.]